jgi:hypothetical protein
LDCEQLLEHGGLRPLRVDGWFALETLDFSNKQNPQELRRMFWSAWNPLRKLKNTLAWRRDGLNNTEK